MDPGLGSEVMEKARGRGVRWWLGQARGEMAVRGLPPLDPSTVLRVSGPSLGMDPGSGAGMTGWMGLAGGVEAFGGVA